MVDYKHQETTAQKLLLKQQTTAPCVCVCACVCVCVCVFVCVGVLVWCRGGVWLWRLTVCVSPRPRCYGGVSEDMDERNTAQKCLAWARCKLQPCRKTANNKQITFSQGGREREKEREGERERGREGGRERENR